MTMTYRDPQGVTHEIVRTEPVRAIPGFHVCTLATGATFFLHRNQIKVDGIVTTKDREHLLTQPEEQGA